MSEVCLLEKRGEDYVQKGLRLLRDKDQVDHGFQQLPAAGEKFLIRRVEFGGRRLGASLCKAHDSHLLKGEEGWGISGPGGLGCVLQQC